MIKCGKTAASAPILVARRTWPEQSEGLRNTVPIGCWSVIRLPSVRPRSSRNVLGMGANQPKLIWAHPFGASFAHVILSDLALEESPPVPNRVDDLHLCRHTSSPFLLFRKETSSNGFVPGGPTASTYIVTLRKWGIYW